MRLGTVDVRVTDASALAGAVAWAGLVVSNRLGLLGEVLALAALVLVPLGLGLAETTQRDGTHSRWYAVAVAAQLPAALAVVASLSFPRGVTATVLAVPWALLTVCVAAFGLWRFRRRGPRPLAELTVDAGLAYLAVGGAALLFDRTGLTLLFDPIVVTLTAVHFHYAGFALPLIAGLAGRAAGTDRLRSLRQAATAIIAVGPGIIATGITAVELDVPLAPEVEFVAVTFFTTAVALFSLSVVAGVVPDRRSRLQQALVTVASLAVTASMGFAVLYGLARMTGGRHLGIHAEAYGTMIRYHGQLNAFGFALLALVGWRLDPPLSDERASADGEREGDSGQQAVD